MELVCKIYAVTQIAFVLATMYGVGLLSPLTLGWRLFLFSPSFTCMTVWMAFIINQYLEDKERV